MKLYHSLVELAGRFAVGIAMLVALLRATVIVLNGAVTTVPVGAQAADRIANHAVEVAPVQPAVIVGQFEPG